MAEAIALSSSCPRSPCWTGPARSGSPKRARSVSEEATPWSHGKAVSQTGAQSAGYILLRLPHQIKAMFLEWLARCYPERAAHVESLLRQSSGGALCDSAFGVRQRGRGPIAAPIHSLFDAFSSRYGLDGPHRSMAAPCAGPCRWRHRRSKRVAWRSYRSLQRSLHRRAQTRSGPGNGLRVRTGTSFAHSPDSLVPRPLTDEINCTVFIGGLAISRA